MIRNKASIEILVGIFMLIGIGGLAFLALQVSGVGRGTGVGSYELEARFENIGGLKVRSPVTVSGVLVGRVTAIEFDNENFEAVVTMDILPEYRNFPTDTSAGILTAGLLGEKYIGLEPGADETVLRDGDQIKFTQSALVLEQLIGKLFTSLNKSD